MALIENMAGVEECRATARTSPLLCALAFGAEDYITDIGGRRTPAGNEVLYARSQVVLAARAAGLLALDQVVVDIRNDEQFLADATAVRNLGYGGKMCLNPRQVELANQSFAPCESELARARARRPAHGANLRCGQVARAWCNRLRRQHA